MKYRPEIDGLRAIAVIPVIFFHAGIESFSGGFVGVDVFFVISGYLITSIIIEELENEKFSIIKFYERRARRILPALVFIVVFFIPIAWVWLDPFSLKELFQSIFAVSVFSANIYFYLKTGYFDVDSEMKPFLHTWSLAVEEQFYVIFPILIVLLWRLRFSYILSAHLIFLFASLFVSQLLLGSNPNAAFYLPHARGWELLLGVVAALLMHRNISFQSSVLRNVLSASGFAMILLSIFLYDETTPFPGWAALMPTLGAALIIMFATHGGYVRRLLGLNIFVSVGLISYSAYLWHQPILAFFRVIYLRGPTLLEVFGLVLATLFLSVLTYRYVETPFRNRKTGILKRRGVFRASGASLIVLVAAGLAGHFSQGFPDRSPGFLRLQQNTGLSNACNGRLNDMRCKSNEDPRLVLWGDSHAMHLAGALELAFPGRGVWQTTLSACPPVPGYEDAPIKSSVTCSEFNARVFSALAQIEHPQEYTIIFSTSQNLAAPPLREDFIETASQLRSRGFKMVLVSSTPRFSASERCIIENMRAERGFEDCAYPFSDALNRETFDSLHALAEDIGIGYVDLSEFFCTSGTCRLENDGVLLLRDSGHLAIESKMLLSRFLKERIR